MTAGDLAGLTPDVIGNALQIGQGQQRINQKKKTDMVDAIYKRALIGEMGSRTEIGKINAQRQLTESMRTAPMEVPGVGKLSLKAWNSLDTKTRAYSYYAYDAKKNDEEVMPYNEWAEQTDDPTAKQIFDLIENDEGFKKFYLEDYKSGTTINIGEKADTARALADVKSEKYFTDPKGGLSADINKHLNSEEVQNNLIQFYDSSDPTKLEQEKVRAKEDFTVGKIKSAGGKIIDSKLDGRDFVWTVKWPNGKTTEVRVGN